MSFLTPLYVLATVAIGLPILFHLIQRRPQGEQDFSSLLFLKPSPPRLTRRSRLDNLLLLLLRALALILIALAFARPFLRSMASLGLDAPARRMVILLDQSASMTRDGLWQRATDEIKKICNEVSNRDRIALLAFSKEQTNVVPFPELGSELTTQLSAIRAASESLKPTWHATDIASALLYAHDTLVTDINNTDGQRESNTIVLISDFQSGSVFDSLESYEWPQNVTVDCRKVTADSDDNAYLTFVELDEEDKSPGELTIRVHNVANSHREQFEVAWFDASTQEKTDGKLVHVPAGQSRSVTIPIASDSSDLVLSGDGTPFDNHRFMAVNQPIERSLFFVGEDEETTSGLYFFLERLNLASPRRNVTLQRFGWSDNLPLEPKQVPLTVVSKDLTAASVGLLKAYLRTGGHVLAVLSGNDQIEQQTVQNWQALTELDSLQIAPSTNESYSMISEIDYRHSLFAPFANAKYGDFTKIRFWRHQKITASHEQPWTVLARFDSNAPALVEREIGDGKLWILTSGWQPEESHLALSSKFVPLLVGMYDLADTADNVRVDYVVGQAISNETMNASQVETPENKIVELNENQPFGKTDAPGIYGFLTESAKVNVSVNLDPRESQTDPIDLSQLEQMGVKMGQYESSQTLQDQHRQMRDMELESQQTIWQYLIVAALVCLGFETILAGRYSTVTRAAESTS